MLMGQANELGRCEWLSARSDRLWGTADDIAARLD
jgi:hypothetical protein